MSLPKEIYVWDEATTKDPQPDLNLERDGSRPMPDPSSKEPIRAGVYKLVHEVEIFQEVKETVIKQATDEWSEIDKW